MTAFDEAVGDYLTIRRAMGYQLDSAAALLDSFAEFLQARQATVLTTELAVAWARQPTACRPGRWAARLTAVRGFAVYLHALDPAHEIPPVGLLGTSKSRATPYLYSPEEIAALIAAADRLHPPSRALTMRTLIALMAVTGMRTGEAVALDCSDIDVSRQLLVIREGKFGKARELVLHSTTVHALRGYLAARRRLAPAPATPALFVTTTRNRLAATNAQHTFREIVARTGLAPRSASCRPRLHDLRHSFAVQTLLDAYQADGDIPRCLALLSTYLGHVEPESTYWYLSAAPELMALAAGRLQDYLTEPRS